MPYVLLLEDIDSDAREVEAALKQIGTYELRRFEVASRAIETLSDAVNDSTELPALIVVDLNLPQSSGYELLRFIHSTPQVQSVPCAVWTVMDSEVDKKLTSWMGSRKLISKNSGPATLRKSLAALLSSSEKSESSPNKDRAEAKSNSEPGRRPPKRA